MGLQLCSGERGLSLSGLAQQLIPYLTYVVEEYMGMGPRGRESRHLLLDIAAKILALGPPPGHAAPP
jgi:hypothetical protein